jgi:hypothetical protein
VSQNDFAAFRFRKIANNSPFFCHVPPAKIPASSKSFRFDTMVASMNLLFSMLVLLIGGVFVFVSIGKAIGSRRYHGAKRWMTVAGGGLLAIGAAGFFGLVFSATGGLNWLPSSFEWPVGSAHGIPVYSWLVGAMGMILLFLADRGKRKQETPA